jgi:hypothetical protein
LLGGARELGRLDPPFPRNHGSTLLSSKPAALASQRRIPERCPACCVASKTDIESRVSSGARECAAGGNQVPVLANALFVFLVVVVVFGGLFALRIRWHQRFMRMTRPMSARTSIGHLGPASPRPLCSSGCGITAQPAVDLRRTGNANRPSRPARLFAKRRDSRACIPASSSGSARALRAR